MFYEPRQRDTVKLPRSPINAIVAPRPIGWISSISSQGDINLAPYSFFNVFCSDPPIIGFSSIGLKDTLSFINETMEFTYSMATADLIDQVHITSSQAPRGASEFTLAGLMTAPSRLVSAPRVAESPAALECRVTQVTRLIDAAAQECDAYLVLGEVIGVYIDDRLLENGRFITEKARPLSRCGYNDYATILSYASRTPA